MEVKMRCGIPLNEYCKIHSWIRYHHGKANKCESPTCTGKSMNYQWALRKGFKYAKNVDNFIMLCISCHLKYDWTLEKSKIFFGIMTNERRKKISDARKKMKMSEETKMKLSERFSGNKNPMYGISLSGDKSAWLGKHHTIETRKKLFTYRAKLTKEQAESIRKEVASGVMQKIIAKKYSISRASICRIVNNKRYILA